METHDLLAGIRVVDAGSWVAGPAAATVMADFGAEVIKVEGLAGGGDLALGLAIEADQNPFWTLDGRSKKSVAVDLKHEAGHRVLRELVGSADVFVSNFRPALIDRLGLGYEALSAVNPRLVYAHVTGYGEAGPEAEKPGYDTTAWWTRTGLMDFVRQPGARPSVSAPGMGDHATAMTLFGGIMAALYKRERTGRGDRVTTSLFANGLWSNGMLLSLLLCGGAMPPREAEAVPNALATQYRTADGRWLQLTLLNEAREWPALLAVLDLEHLADDPRFADAVGRREHAGALHDVLAERIGAMDRTAVREAMDRAALPAALLTTLEDVLHDEQAAANDLLTATAAPEPGWERTIASPLWLEDAPKQVPRKAPTIGADTREVLGSLGYDAAAVDALVRDGVVGVEGGS